MGQDDLLRTVVMRITALAVLLLLILFAILGIQTMRRLPNSVVYLVRSQERFFELERVGRRSPGSGAQELARSQLLHLISGPTAEESQEGLSTSFPDDLAVLDLRVQDGVVEVDLSEAFEAGGGSAQMQARLYQLFYTLTEPNSVSGVRLLIEGEPITIFGGEGIIVDSPWFRSDHPRLPAW